MADAEEILRRAKGYLVRLAGQRRGLTSSTGVSWMCPLEGVRREVARLRRTERSRARREGMAEQRDLLHSR